jgi:hypothetical protein
MDDFKCVRCKKSFDEYDSLKRHVGRKHKIHASDFYVEFKLNGELPKCKCGCGQIPKWNKGAGTFRKLCKGHYSRIHNNWGHNKVAREKSAETRRQQFSSGERHIWNEGLTMENDGRVKTNIERSTNSINSSSSELKRRSIFMSEQRKNGNIKILYGPDSSHWKGGVSEVNNIVRSDKRLYEEWKYPILVRDGFKCVECLDSKNLHVHHDKERMCEIVKKHIVDELHVNNFDLKKAIASKIVEYHIQNNVSGITLCGSCHGEYHPSLNFS